ncbi:MAG: TonB-dependent receptor [Halioglobus sp.]
MNKKLRFPKKSLAVAVATSSLILGQSSIALAQDSVVLEEVIVTATARSQSTQDIPFNISAVQGSDIADQMIVDNADLMRTIPGVSLIDRGHKNSGIVNSMIIRGINVDSGAGGDIGYNTAGPVSTYVDNTPMFANFLLKDLQRVEVLRGPQGTLYGSGALGGTVRYIMNKPNTEQLEGSIDASYSQTEGSDGDNVSFDGVLNVPLSDRVAFRIAAGTLQNDGVIDYNNLYQTVDNIPVVKDDDGNCLSVSDPSLSLSEINNNGSCYTSKKDADDVDIWYARASLRFEASDELAIQLNYQVQEDEVGARRSVTNGIDGWGNEYGDFEGGATYLEPSERDAELLSLDVDWDLGFATLTSNTSFYDTEADGWRDNSSLWTSGGRDWFDRWYTGNPRPAAFVEAGVDEDAFVQEFRLVSNTSQGDSFDWVAGVYYMDQDRTTTNFSHLYGLREWGDACAADDNCRGEPFWWSGSVHDMDSTLVRDETFEDLAVYGELTYHINDTLRVTGGLRWFDNELTNSTAMNAFFAQGVPVPFEDYPDQNEDDVLVKLNVSWDVSDQMMLYATYSEGFRRGGTNSIPDEGTFAELNPESAAQYTKDTVSNYEIGIKGGTDRLRYTADVYYVDWQDPQLNTTTAWWGFFMAQNGESAATQGVELELEALLTENLNMTVGYSYTDAELTDDLIQPQSSEVIAEDGQRLPGTAENVVTLGFSHVAEFSSGMSLNTRLNGYYQSDTTNHIENGVVQDDFDSFSLWNITASLLMDNWRVSLYGKNIFDEDGITGNFPSAYFSNDNGVNESYFGNNQRDYISTPRTLGLSVGYNF